MDAVKALNQIHREFTECSLCTNQFVTPKILPCLHTFCLSCLEQYGKGKKVAEVICCPLCRQEFTLQAGRFDALPCNFNVNRLIELRQSFINTPNSNWCQCCNSDENTGASQMTPATGYCVECEKEVCATCLSKHGDENHHVRCLRDIGGRESPNSVTSELAFCSEHSNEPFSLYCLECGTVVCVKCFCRLHNTHKCCDIDEAAEKCKIDFDGELKALNVIASKLKHLSARQSAKIRFFSASVNQSERQIIEATEKVKQHVDQHKIKLIESLKTVSQPTLAQLQQFRISVNSSISTIDNLIEQAGKAQMGSNSLNLLLTACKLKSVKMEFEAMVANDTTVHKQLYFFPILYDAFPSAESNLIGNIIECDDDQQDQEDESDDEEENSVGSIIRVEEDLGCVASELLVEECTRCGDSHNVAFCSYPFDITCFRCGGNHHIRICDD